MRTILAAPPIVPRPWHPSPHSEPNQDDWNQHFLVLKMQSVFPGPMAEKLDRTLGTDRKVSSYRRKKSPHRHGGNAVQFSVHNKAVRLSKLIAMPIWPQEWLGELYTTTTFQMRTDRPQQWSWPNVYAGAHHKYGVQVESTQRTKQTCCVIQSDPCLFQKSITYLRPILLSKVYGVTAETLQSSKKSQLRLHPFGHTHASGTPRRREIKNLLQFCQVQKSSFFELAWCVGHLCLPSTHCV